MDRIETFSVWDKDGNEAVVNKDQWEEWRERGYSKKPPKPKEEKKLEGNNGQGAGDGK